jgi:hypothetical protein
MSTKADIMRPVQMFWGSHSDVAKDAILLGCDTHSVNEQFPIFQTIHCLRVQGAKQSKANTVTMLHWTLQHSVMWHYIVAQVGPDAPEECSSFFSYGPLCQTRGMKLLRLSVTFDHWLSPWHDKWNQWSKQKGSGLLIKAVNFWKQPI